MHLIFFYCDMFWGLILKRNFESQYAKVGFIDHFSFIYMLGLHVQRGKLYCLVVPRYRSGNYEILTCFILAKFSFIVNGFYFLSSKNCLPKKLM